VPWHLTIYAANRSSPAMSSAASATLLSTEKPECRQERIWSITSCVILPWSSRSLKIFDSQILRNGVVDRSSGIRLRLSGYAVTQTG